ncbi:MAG: DUF4445 domain-containing protein [Clostridia bacterium]|nr:DUF4445 domain-containing protein [Clostridia bacterium]
MFEANINENLFFPFSEETLLSELLRRAGENISMPCAGNGTCGKCKVIATGSLSSLTQKEQTILTDEEIKNNIRLACQAKATGNVTITAETLAPVVEIDFSWEDYPVPYDYTDGLVIDIGTTTIAAILYENKEIVKKITEENYQTAYGADVISRIAFDKEHPNLLSNLLQKQISEIITRCDTPKNIVIVANTVMLHFLTGQDVSPLGEAPYTLTDFFGKEYSIDGVNCYLAPCISAFVGADITAGILASRMAESKESAMLVDLGTNGEIAYFDGSALYTTSTAAGPAFEGAGIFMGMPAKPGAIDRVWIENSEISHHVIGDAIPRGISGSGIVDVLAVMKTIGVLDESGCLIEEHPLCQRDHHGKPCFRIPDTDVMIRASDIRKLQLAKAAIHAGILTLANKVDTLYLSGGFGAKINSNNAEAIGLLPKNFAKTTKALGNTALFGGTLALFSKDIRKQMSELSRNVKSIPLNQNPYFTGLYIDKMQF